MSEKKPFERILSNAGIHAVLRKVFGKNSPVKKAKPKRCNPSIKQQRIWFLEQVFGSDVQNGLLHIYEINEELNLNKLNDTLKRYVDHQESLRVFFPAIGGYEVHVRNNYEIKIDLYDSQGLSRDECVRKIKKTAETNIDFSRETPIQLSLYQTGATNYLFAIQCHPIIADSYSLDLLVNDLFSDQKSKSCEPFYRHAEGQLKEIEGNGFQREVENWKLILDGVPTIELSADMPRPPTQAYESATYKIDLPRELRNKVKSYCSHHEMDVSSYFLAVFNALIYRYSSVEDIAIGNCVTHRSNGLVDTFGNLENVSVIRTQLNAETLFSNLLEGICKSIKHAEENGDVPFEHVLDRLHVGRSLSSSPLFQIMYAFDDIEMESRHVELIHSQGRNPGVDLLLRVSSEHLSFEYNGLLFSPDRIKRMAGHFFVLLGQTLSKAELPISQLELLAELEKKQIFEDWNCPAETLKNELCFHELLDLSSRTYPNHTAVVFNDRELTYDVFNKRINQVVHYLLKEGVKEGSFIGLYMDRSLDMLVSFIAIWRLSSVAVPLDIDNPPARQKLILEDSHVTVILTQEQLRDRVSRETTAAVRVIDIDDEGITSQSEELPRIECNINDLAQLIYTSGSTGHPKGVEIRHSNINHYCYALQQAFELNSTDRYLYRGSISLIVSARQFLMPLVHGATVICINKEQAASPIDFLQLAKDQGATIVDHVPAFWRNAIQVINNLDDADRKDLFNNQVRLVAAGGEIVPMTIMRFWRENTAQGIQLYNMYGQTEGTGVVSTYEVKDVDFDTYTNVPVGFPIAGNQLYVLDQNLKLLPVGIPGEIHVSGNTIADAYFNNEELSNQYFIDHPFTPGTKLYKTGDLGYYNTDGSISYVARMDDQIQLRGRRVELGEIETKISEYDGIKDVAVMIYKSETGEDSIVAYYISKNDASVEPVELKNFLKSHLPDYMLPSFYSELEEFPLTTSAKIDMQALPAPNEDQLAIEHSQYIGPRTDVEKSLYKVWSKVLLVEKIGMRDGFFDLGGNSLLGVELIAQVESELKQKLPLKALFQFSTIEQMACAIEEEACSDHTLVERKHFTEDEYRIMLTVMISCGIPQLRSDSLVVRLNQTGKKRPLIWCFNSPGREMPAFAKELGDDQPLYGLMSSVELGQSQEILEKVASHYVDEILNLNIVGPFYLGGNCRGAKVMSEIFFQLRYRGVEVQKVALVEFFHPKFYDYSGRLLLLFGRKSDYQRQKLLRWKDEGWEKPFARTPDVDWLECAHGQFFNESNIHSLASKVSTFLDA
jgi:amino acid adenylation domain-containing protein